MNWLLINPTQHFLNMFPLGLAYVSSALKAAGVDVRLLDLGFVGGGCEDTRSAIANAMREAPVDVIGIGGLYAEHPHITRVISWCREANPHAVIVAGNGVVSCDPVLMLPALGADFAVIGEGEESAVALHKVLESGGDPRTVQGIAFRDKDGTVVVTEPRTKFIDLDLIPMPDYEGFQVRRYIDARPGSVYYGYSFVDNYRGLPILASRSCPLACTFCYHAIGSYRRRSVEHFFSEVKLLIEKYDVNSLQIYDDLFASKRDRVIEFCEDIKQYGLLWEISLRVQNIAPGKIDGPVLALMREAGCRSIGLGLESVSAKVLASMKKKITKEQIATALDLITQANINFQGNFIFGDRAETEETANESLDWWRRNRQYLIQTDPIWAFPGTEVYVRGKADGRIPDDATYLASPYPIVNLTDMDQKTFDQMRDVILMFRLYLNRAPAQLLEIASGDVVNGISTFNTTSLCPHCGGKVSYKDIACWQRIICRACGGMFDIPIARLLGRSRLPPDSTAELERAAAALAAGDLDLAFKLSHTCFEADEHDWGALEIMGTALLLGGEITRAHFCLRRSLDVNPDNGSACNNLGITLYATNAVAAALLFFRQAIHVEDSIPEAVHNEAAALNVLGGDDHILDFVHSPDRPQLPIDGLKVAIPSIRLGGSNVAHHPPFRNANDRLLRAVQAWIKTPPPL